MFKAFPAELAMMLRSRRGSRNLRVLLRFLAVLAGMILIFTVVFHLLMLREGQDHTWITGFYWTLTVMSTLGFGDITFHTDLGRLFSIVVLLSGMIFLLVLLPFTFIEFFYEPWMNARAASRAPRQLPPDIRGHVILTHHDEVSSALIRRLEQYDYQYALLVPEVEDALRLHDQGLKVMVGDLDDPETWKRARVESAALVASTANDVVNTNVAFTARELAKNVPIVTSVREDNSVDILTLAGSDHVLKFAQMIGQSFSVRTLGGDAKAHVIGQFDQLQIAEAAAHRTPLVGKTLQETALREKAGVTVVGVWERGRFELARGETMIHDNTVLVLAGSKKHLARYNKTFSEYSTTAAPVMILGGGGVGRATARALASRGVDYRIVEINPDLIVDPQKDILGNAADLAILEKAGIYDTSTAIVTTNKDDLNVYLTIYCRQLRPDIQILSRATYERNVATLHRAGADIVLSYASMGAGAVLNMLRRGGVLMVAEGLNMFKVRMPAPLAGMTIAQSAIREDTGCSVVAMETERGTEVIPNPFETMPADAEIVLIGTVDAEERFLERYGAGKTS